MQDMCTYNKDLAAASLTKGCFDVGAVEEMVKQSSEKSLDCVWRNS
jgi:hypothetical protein